ncbi:YcdB/YcdC domain-containing protein [Brevibacillus sp. 179-C9.3 HS]|uniref:YcdB/YcdC domain-containing protein n=1 Tax=unclassified Brevibacillus TaxID=2684853 RepID=UPI0039A16A2B
MKMRNKAAMLVLAVGMLTVPLTAVHPYSVYAYDGKSKLEPIELPADIVHLLKELKEDYVPLLESLHVDYFGGTSNSGYAINLSDRKSVITTNTTLRLSTNADGDLTQLVLHDVNRDKTTKLNQKEAYQKAVDFIRNYIAVDHVISPQAKISVDRASELDNLAVVSVYPQLNNTWVDKETARVMVDANGQVVRFQQEKVKLPTPAEVADPAKAIPLEKVREEWRDKVSLELAYDERAGKLVYVPDQLPIMDALTGEDISDVFKTDRERMNIKGTADLSVWLDTKKMEQMLEKDFALNLKERTYNNVTEDKKYKNSDIDRHEWRARSYQSAAITLDRKTKAPIEIKLDGSVEKELEKPLSDDEAKEVAVQFVTKYLLSKEQAFSVKETHLVKSLPGWADQNLVRPVSSFAFYPESNGIPTKKPLFYIEVDAKKGLIVLAKVNDLPSVPASLSKEGLVSVDKATEAYGKQAELRLAYWYPRIGKHSAKLPQLAYLPTLNAKALQVDAATGKVEESWLEWTAAD